MVKKSEKSYCHPGENLGECCCKIESMISVDERGQMVLPKEIRDKGEIRAGDKLAVVSWEKNGKVCCISLIKAEEFEDMVRSMLLPLMKELVQK